MLLAQLKRATANERQGVKVYAAALFPRIYRETGGPEGRTARPTPPAFVTA